MSSRVMIGGGTRGWGWHGVARVGPVGRTDERARLIRHSVILIAHARIRGVLESMAKS